MTEQEWLASSDPAAMLRHLTHQKIQTWTPHGQKSDVVEQERQDGLASDRKLRLFACACVRQGWHLLTDARSRNAVEVAEKFADGLATNSQLTAARVAAWSVIPGARASAFPVATRMAVEAAAWAATTTAASLATMASKTAARKQANIESSSILRCICGNHWRPVTVERSWLTPDALAIARKAYDERHDDGTLDPVTLAILADALEEAGCDNEDILRHLRSTGPHVRGCHALDLVLGKE